MLPKKAKGLKIVLIVLGVLLGLGLLAALSNALQGCQSSGIGAENEAAGVDPAFMGRVE